MVNGLNYETIEVFEFSVDRDPQRLKRASGGVDPPFISSTDCALDKAGEVRWFRDEAILVRDPSGRPIAWHGVLVETTGMKKLRH